MKFRNRIDAGKQLSTLLTDYKGTNTIVYALPRGGVVVACEIAKSLACPLDLVITRKIGHPNQPEYAIAAVAENGHIAGKKYEINNINQEWFKQEVGKERKEAQRRRQTYLQGIPHLSAHDKVAIIVDDGIATGLTMEVAIGEIKHQRPKKIIVAVPVAPQDTLENIRHLVDDIIVIEIPKDFQAIGAFYENFAQVTDDEVIAIIKKSRQN